MTRGVCLIAYGGKAATEAVQCLTSLRHFHDWPYITMTHVTHRTYTDVQQSRWAKVTLDRWSPFDETLYLDADTRVQGDISAGFEILRDGWDMVIAPSAQQGSDLMWHIGSKEREETMLAYGCADILQLQGGVFWFQKSAAMLRLFEAWRDEWVKYTQFDQAALLRALIIAPVKLYLMGYPFNGGAIIAHKHGQAVR
jgi:hypothetical protein